MRVKDKSEVFHSSGYAKAQSGANFGAASNESFSARKTIDENRKFVRKYNNARIMNNTYAFERAKRYIPRTGKATEESKATSAGGGDSITRGGATGQRGSAGRAVTTMAAKRAEIGGRRATPMKQVRL